uniref:Lipocln_cytosolic_FA-bd_dom domain-containing protein n=2 Tax=Bursaphelenchus xylophilus TaxID=6326 RepID=A0A1I7SJT9_BURXY
LLRQVVNEEIAEKTVNNMYFAVDDVNIDHLMGRWVTVVDSPFLHRQYCAVNYFRLSEKTKYTADFVTHQTSRNSEEVVTYNGFGQKVGPDPGSVFIHTGNPSDPCPFIPVKVGPSSKKSGQFEYVILTTPLKTPTVVLARDARLFQKEYRAEVEDYLKRFNYLNPVTALNQPLHFLNVSNCNTYQHFDYDLGMDD